MTAFEKIVSHISNMESFVLEAGAGSGKTYTLIQTLNYLLSNNGDVIEFNNQKIVCITYTNVAKNEIVERLERNPLILVSTIHEFLWDCIKSYQPQLKKELCKLNEIRSQEEDATKETLTPAKKKAFIKKYVPDLNDRIGLIDNVYYNDSSFRDFEKGLLHHDDVLKLSEMMFASNKVLTTILSQKYPYILIDEYQDTAPEVINAIVHSLLERHKSKVLLGFYGDSHQKIYNAGVGSLAMLYSHSLPGKNILKEVQKEENYRSSKRIVSLLNHFRTNITQIPISTSEGSATVIICNNSAATNEAKDANYEKVVNMLKGKRWEFENSDDTKILMVTNSRVAKRAKFSSLYTVFSSRYGQRTKEQLLDRNNHIISLFTGHTDKKTSQEREVGIEHLYRFWINEQYNEVITYFKRHTSYFYDSAISHKDKVEISKLLTELSEIRSNGTINDMYFFATAKLKINISFSLKLFMSRIDKSKEAEFDEHDKRNYDFWLRLSALKYQEISNFFNHKIDNTIFSTKHGTKGDEYKNVLTIIDDNDWKSEYNFNKFFNDSDDNMERKMRTRNLFYVECSRAKENLTVLALSSLDAIAVSNLKKWFGDDNVVNIEDCI